ncbi:unnamed protein product [Oppiella nova]|uniref:Uncharacterized protein n=1 Tax=Oppiella nova TaxID=334625 RepID=A0A7R9MEJ5_9ACAR|nr:unnamed protein product [Oppiella nova]CAG2175764.1 unnamed protein product [Oppiella nova]
MNDSTYRLTHIYNAVTTPASGPEISRPCSRPSKRNRSSEATFRRNTFSGGNTPAIARTGSSSVDVLVLCLGFSPVVSHGFNSGLKEVGLREQVGEAHDREYPRQQQ